MIVTHDTHVIDTLDFSGATTYGDFRDDLARDGYAVVKGAIPRQKAAEYVERYHEYLESFGLGYDRNDPSTIREENLPVISERGMLGFYGVAHEDFVWDMRAEPGVIAAFETIFDTEDLIVSFDQINVTFPNRKDLKPNKRWAHQDQDPERAGLRCVQGIINLLPNGEKDGGLMVLPGAHNSSEEFHKLFKDEPQLYRWTNEVYNFTEAGLEWLKARGFEWKKVNCEPGDLIVWDSRLPHYNVSPQGNQARFASYVCYGPVSTAEHADLVRKKEAFESYLATSHWPQALQTAGHLKCLRPDGTECPYARNEPRQPPQLSERAYKLTGIPYLQARA